MTTSPPEPHQGLGAALLSTVHTGVIGFKFTLGDHSYCLLNTQLCADTASSHHQDTDIMDIMDMDITITLTSVL